jgi:hypothetical protein
LRRELVEAKRADGFGGGLLHLVRLVGQSDDDHR